jgi:hypothetical protein
MPGSRRRRFRVSVQYDLYPEFGLGIALLTNSDGHSFQRSLPNQILDRFIAAKLGRAPAEAAKITDSGQKSYQVMPSRQRMLAGQYLYNRGGTMTLLFRNGRLGIGGGSEVLPVTWVSGEEGFTLRNGRQFFYRFMRNEDGTPAYLVRMNDGEFLDYNGGPEDRPGPNKPEWDRYVGKFRYTVFGQVSGNFEVRKQNGYLFVEDMRLEEFQPGLFFTSHGEVLDLRGPAPALNNIKLEKITIPPLLKDALLACQLIFVTALLVWPVTFVVRLVRARKRPGAGGSKRALPWVTRLVGSMVAAVDLVVIYLLLTSLSVCIHYGIDWSPRLPSEIKMSIVGFLMSTWPAFLLPVLTVLAWKRRYWTRVERLHYSLVAGAALFVSAVFLAWKLPRWPL